MAELREVGDEAAWSLSSAKPGNGVEQLRDGNTETFWQSDGPQPHLINIQFQRKLRVSELRIFTNHKVDESYTPSCISVRIGTAHHDLQEIQVIDLREPDGWITVRLARSLHEPAPEEATPWCVPRDPDMGGAADFSSQGEQGAVGRGRDPEVAEMEDGERRRMGFPGRRGTLVSMRQSARTLSSWRCCPITRTAGTPTSVRYR
ncbi:unnamed protein product [Prorocentrum cordatum]|uniref:DOC domain-containing protein n=1 Tax=Prorocentrum cordatum TaxID=2364126 RepID=A0ABN9VBV5_9DINO|nr:unnamed protein product [Polarella glacialis]